MQPLTTFICTAEKLFLVTGSTPYHSIPFYSIPAQNQTTSVFVYVCVLRPRDLRSAGAVKVSMLSAGRGAADAAVCGGRGVK